MTKTLLTTNAVGALAAGKTRRLRTNADIHTERVASASERHVELMRRAERAGAHRRDPIWKKFVAGHYGKLPLVWSKTATDAIGGSNCSEIVVGGWIDAEGCRMTGADFRVVGQIQFAPGGGILGVIVYDKNDHVAFCTGTLDAAATTKWSWITRDFSLLNLNDAGLTPEAVKADAEARAKADGVTNG